MYFLTIGIPSRSAGIVSISAIRLLRTTICVTQFISCRRDSWHLAFDGTVALGTRSFPLICFLQPRTNQTVQKSDKKDNVSCLTAKTSASLFRRRTQISSSPCLYLVRAVLDREVAVVRNSSVSATGTSGCSRGRPCLRHFPPGDKEVSRGIGVAAAHTSRGCAYLENQRQRGRFFVCVLQVFTGNTFKQEFSVAVAGKMLHWRVDVGNTLR